MASDCPITLVNKSIIQKYMAMECGYDELLIEFRKLASEMEEGVQ